MSSIAAPVMQVTVNLFLLRCRFFQVVRMLANITLPVYELTCPEVTTVDTVRQLNPNTTKKLASKRPIVVRIGGIVDLAGHPLNYFTEWSDLN
jgi:hypothetical protein